MADFRIEKDYLGEKKIPSNAYYGIHTERSLENFQIKKPLQKELIYSIVQIKKACAQTNFELKELQENKKKAIIKACEEILSGKFDDQFQLSVFQAGSATSTHMNVNEVIANRAIEILSGKKGDYKIIHPNDDVNKGQSTNNVIPSAIRISSIKKGTKLELALSELIKSFSKKAKEFRTIIKCGRTHLQDAVPITLGQEFSAYEKALSKHLQKIKESKKYLNEIIMGGSAVGTGINTYSDFGKKATKHLSKETGLQLKESNNPVESTQFLTDISGLSSALKNLAIDLNKISTDLELMASGPNAGFNEIELPSIEPGSSIMPGKVNPSICEVVKMSSIQAIGNDTAITIACANGRLELNTHMPLIAHNILDLLELLEGACIAFSKKCVDGIKANKEVCLSYAEKSPSLATVLNPIIGYDKAAEVVKESLKRNESIKKIAIEKRYITQKEAEKIFDTHNLTKPNLKHKK